MGADAVIPDVGLPTDRLKLVKTDLGGLTLKPEEMFVVSRLAGVDLRVSDLLVSCGLPRAQAVSVISRLLKAGVFKNLDAQSSPTSAASSGPPARPTMPARPAVVAASYAAATATAAATAPKAPGPMLAPIDPEAVDLPADRQHELAALEARIRSKNPREVLGLTAAATVEEIKAAYFSLAQRFHPDQFFRKRLGSFKSKVDEVFARTNWAFQELSRDPSAGAEKAPADKASTASDNEPGAQLEGDLPTDLELPDGDALPESAELPDMLDEEAASITGRPRDRYRKAMLRQRWDVAADALNSLANDEPNALDLPKLRAELSRKKSEVEAKVLFERGNELAGNSNWAEAFKCYQQAAALDSRNAVYVERAGRALLYEGDLKEAKRLVERALELRPDDAVAHVTLANVFLKAGMERNAKREFEVALKIDPKNEYAKSQVRKSWWKG